MLDKHSSIRTEKRRRTDRELHKIKPFSSTSGSGSAAAGSSSCLFFLLILNSPPSLRKLLFKLPNLPLFLSSATGGSFAPTFVVVVPALVTVSKLELLSPTVVTYSPEVLHANLFRSSSDEERAITVSGELPPSFALSLRSILTWKRGTGGRVEGAGGRGMTKKARYVCVCVRARQTSGDSRNRRWFKDARAMHTRGSNGDIFASGCVRGTSHSPRAGFLRPTRKP